MPAATMPKSGIYAITPSDLRPEFLLLEQVEALLATGVAVLQYRDKQAGAARRLRLATQLRTLCEAVSVPLIINDDVDLAIRAQADGVHLGRDDQTISEARQRMPNAIIGASCYASIERANAAASAGASYVAFGRFFHSATKPDASPADLSVLKQWRSDAARGSDQPESASDSAANLPTVAIGGIDAGNGATILSAGADLLAVCGGIFNAESPAKAAQNLVQLYQ